MTNDRELLRQLLAEHGLVAEASASGWLVVRRAVPFPEPSRTLIGSPPIVLHDNITVRPNTGLVISVLNDGQPLRDLERGNFVVKVNGKRREILDLRLIDSDGGALPPHNAADTLPYSRSLFLLLVDTSGDRPSSIERARDAARALLSEIDPSAYVALAVHPGRDVYFLAGHSGSSLGIESALEQLTSWARPRSRVRSSEIVREATGGQLVNTRGEETLESGFTNELRRAEHLKEAHLAIDLFGAVGAVAHYDPGLLGRRQIVLLSPGFDDVILEGADGAVRRRRAHVDEMNRASESGQFWLLDNDLRFGNQLARAGLLDVSRALEATGGRLFAVYTGAPERARRNGLGRLAAAANGTAFSGVPAFREALPSLLESTSSTYVLSLETLSGDGAPGQSVEVRLRRAPRRARLIYNRMLRRLQAR